MQKADALAAAYVALLLVIVLSGCGSGDPFVVDVDSIRFQTTQADFDGNPAGAGVLYSQEIVFTTTGNAAPPDTFELDGGVLPPGIQLLPDRVNPQGEFDPAGELNGNARLVGYPRVQGDYAFRIRAISTGALGGLAQSGSGGGPNLTVSDEFVVSVGEGSINILTPEGNTSDPAVPAFPPSIDFVNPANETAFFSWAFPIAGGSGSNLANIYIPRELELSVFDTTVVDGIHEVTFDTDESAASGLDKFEVFFGDGGWFVLQAGNEKVQFGGFQSPRGPVDTIQEYEGGAGLDPDWFQRTTGSSGPDRNSRRHLGDTSFPDGDDSLGAESGAIQFSDYFDGLVMNPDGSVTREHDDRYEGTWDGWRPPDDADPGKPVLSRRKYPFTSDQYKNAFFSTFDSEVDLTPLKFRAIVEAIDTNGTVSTKVDDTVVRKSYLVNVRIPDIVIDTISLPGGTAGIEYTEIIAASGGVPPLEFGLEWVDSTLDLTTTDGDLINKKDFGLEVGTLNSTAGQFFGVPRASGDVELNVFVTAAVLNPIQGETDPSKYRPTGVNPGEWVGTNPLTGNTGIHKTFQVSFGTPTQPALVTVALPGGEDGKKYPVPSGQNHFDMEAGGGVPLMDLETRLLKYLWNAEYPKDASWPGEVGDIDQDRPVPYGIDFDLDIGRLSGQMATDRGFHPITFYVQDYYLGDASAPDLDANRQQNNDGNGEIRALSISPDSAVYMRGAPTTDGGTPSGLADMDDQIDENRMVPMFLEAALYETDTGSPPGLLDLGDMPKTADILPVILTHGGSDSHVDKSIPSISGFWPAEAGKLDRWSTTKQSQNNWRHLQQEHTWIQLPDDTHTRVFLWAETEIAEYGSPAQSTNATKRYQQYDDSGKRGVMVQHPLTGTFWIPAIIENGSTIGDGEQFGGEFVMGSGGTSVTSSTYGSVYAWYSTYYSYARNILPTRAHSVQGLSAYIESTSSGSSGRDVSGRTGTSVAVSANGVWSATVMPGGDGPLFLLWRNDGIAIPTAILSQSYVSPVSGVDVDGNDISGNQAQACIVRVGGQQTNGGSGPDLLNDQRYLLPDSIMFVEGGLLFLMENQLDYVFGFNLEDATFSAADLNSRTAISSAQGTSATTAPVNAGDGILVPDTDILRGMKQVDGTMAQFVFAGNEPADGAEGPNKVALVAGDTWTLVRFDDNSSSYSKLKDRARSGYSQAGDRNRALLFIEMDTTGGLDLGNSTVKDLSGSDNRVYGDLLTPGRMGEEADFMNVSPDGKYVAVVRDIQVNGGRDWGSYSYIPAYATITSSATFASYYLASDDLMLFSTTGTDLDTKSGTQTVLYFGTAGYTANGANPPVDAAAYVSGRNHINAKGRRVDNVFFTDDSKTLIFHYKGHNTYWMKYNGSSDQWGINGHSGQSSTWRDWGAEISLRVMFRTASDGPINFASPSSWMKNNLEGIQGTKLPSIGDTAAPFTVTSGGSQTQFWATFQSPNGEYLYYVIDGISSSTEVRNLLVGVRINSTDSADHDAWEPFTNHADTIGFEEFDVNSWNYESRLLAVPGGVMNGTTGHDGDGIVFIIGSDSSAGASDENDLEVYAFDANTGGDLKVLTPNVTSGSSVNHINYMYSSADGNFLAAQRSTSSGSSAATRVSLVNETDLFVVTNVHDVLFNDAAPNDVIVSADKSHGSTVAFVGDGTVTGAQAVVYSAAASSTSSHQWDKRTLNVGLFAEGALPAEVDSVESHYVVLAGKRKLDDDPTTAN